jgi:pimeloyl-ACP methyl ester carboxylesterase
MTPRWRWRRLPLLLLITTLSAWLLLCALAFAYQRSLLYFPMADNRPSGQPGLALDLAGPQGRIQAWLVHPELLGQGPLLVYCGGNAENAAQARLAFERQPWPTLCWNYPGYAGSQGRPSEAAILAAGHSLLAAVEARFGQQDLVFMGRSLGAAVAVALASEHPCRALVLVSPSDSLATVAAGHYPLLPVGLLMLDPWRSDLRARQLRTPALMIAGRDDQVIPAERAEALATAWQGPCRLHLLPGLDHNELHQHPDYWPLISAFLQSPE